MLPVAWPGNRSSEEQELKATGCLEGDDSSGSRSSLQPCAGPTWGTWTVCSILDSRQGLSEVYPVLCLGEGGVKSSHHLPRAPEIPSRSVPASRIGVAVFVRFRRVVIKAGSENVASRARGYLGRLLNSLKISSRGISLVCPRLAAPGPELIREEWGQVTPCSSRFPFSDLEPILTAEPGLRNTRRTRSAPTSRVEFCQDDSVSSLDTECSHS
ncbi:hypothetical protein CB1_000832011 [Camelus ferus]|nr:hypothetical protein CB1_000832011 [Camelus ferus]